MEELLRQAFQLGQQWVQDMNNDKEPKNFNEWYASDEVQQQVKNCSIPVVSRQCECEFSIESRQGVDFVRCVNCGDTYYKK